MLMKTAVWQEAPGPGTRQRALWLRSPGHPRAPFIHPAPSVSSFCKGRMSPSSVCTVWDLTCWEMMCTVYSWATDNTAGPSLSGWYGSRASKKTVPLLSHCKRTACCNPGSQKWAAFTTMLRRGLKSYKIRSGSWKTNITWYAEEDIRVEGVILLKICLMHIQRKEGTDTSFWFTPWTMSLNPDSPWVELAKKYSGQVYRPFLISFTSPIFLLY